MNLAVGRLLDDRARSGRQPRLLLEDQETILAMSCKRPQDFGKPGSMWTLRRLCGFLNEQQQYPKPLSISYISKLHKKRHIVPHRVRYYLTSKDPLAEEKRLYIGAIYKGLKENSLNDYEVISVDEKTCIQAHKNIREDILPNTKGTACRLRDPEYERLGVTHLIAGQNLRSGEVYGITVQRNRTVEFFVNLLNCFNICMDLFIRQKQ